MEEPINQISIIIPAYNCASFIQETIQSIKDQTMAAFDCLIVDDGSTDNSRALIQAQIQNDRRFQYHLRPSGYLPGGCGARNYGMKLAQTPWVMFLDADDLLAPICLEHRLAKVRNNLEARFAVFHTGTFNSIIGDRDLIWNSLDNPHEPLLRFLALDIPWSTPGVLWNRAFLQSLEGWNENLKSFQDWELHVRALNATHDFIIDKEIVLDHYYRIDQANSISTKFETESYRWQVFEAFRSVEQISSAWDQKLRLELEILIRRQLILRPLISGLRGFPYKVLKANPFFLNISKWKFKRWIWQIRLQRNKPLWSLLKLIRPKFSKVKQTIPSNHLKLSLAGRPANY